MVTVSKESERIDIEHDLSSDVGGGDASDNEEDRAELSEASVVDSDVSDRTSAGEQHSK